jgi:uncharacterized protein (TIGR00730 family)
MTRNKAVCVYCSSSDSIDESFIALAASVGARLAQTGYSLVSGGGRVSMMGAVARAAREGGAHTVGVIPRHLVPYEVADNEADELIVVETMRGRKQLMDERSDAFIALPGGIGTLEELVEQLTWAQLGRHTKPIVLVNIDGFYAPFLTLIRHMQAEAFIKPDMDVRFITVDRAEDVVAAILAAAAQSRHEPAAAGAVSDKF